MGHVRRCLLDQILVERVIGFRTHDAISTVSWQKVKHILTTEDHLLIPIQIEELSACHWKFKESHSSTTVCHHVENY